MPFEAYLHRCHEVNIVELSVVRSQHDTGSAVAFQHRRLDILSNVLANSIVWRIAEIYSATWGSLLDPWASSGLCDVPCNIQTLPHA